jgi:hypothetical protein
MSLEARDAVVPQAPVLLGPLRDFLNAIGLELVDALASFFFFANESRASQHSQVL